MAVLKKKPARNWVPLLPELETNRNEVEMKGLREGEGEGKGEVPSSLQQVPFNDLLAEMSRRKK